MTKQILFNQKYEIDGLFSLPWGKCLGKLNLDVGKVPTLELILQVANNNKNELILQNQNKIQYKESSRYQIVLDPDYAIQGDSFSYGTILILQPDFACITCLYGELIKIDINFRYILSGDIKYLIQPNSSPCFKTAKLFIDSTKIWLNTSDPVINKAFNNETKEFFNVKIERVTDIFNVKNGYTIKEGAYIQFDFDKEKSIDDINNILYQWEIFQSLISGICTKITKITLHHETPDQKNTILLYNFQFPDSDRNFIKEIPRSITFSHKRLGYPNYNDVIKKWFSRDKKQESRGNLFYCAISWKYISLQDKFLNIVKALEGFSTIKKNTYIEGTDSEKFINDDELQKALCKYLNTTEAQDFLKKSSGIEKTNFKQRIKVLTQNHQDFLDKIKWKDGDEKKIVALRNKCAHHRSSYSGNMEGLQEWFYKIMLLLIYIQLTDLGISKENVINFVQNNYRSIISYHCK